MSEKINSHRELEVYKFAFAAAMEIFQSLDNGYENILAMLNSMEMKADKFCYNR